MNIERTNDPNGIDFRKKFELEGKVIIITGGSGLIGRAFAEAVCQFGGNAVIADIPKANPNLLAGELEKKHGKKKRLPKLN